MFEGSAVKHLFQNEVSKLGVCYLLLPRFITTTLSATSLVSPSHSGVLTWLIKHCLSYFQCSTT